MVEIPFKRLLNYEYLFYRIFLTDNGLSLRIYSYSKR